MRWRRCCPARICSVPERAEKLPADNAVELKDVRFAYHDKEVLHGIDLHIAPGTVNALVGPSGSGKSTIARLIASLWDVKDGEIDLGGVTFARCRWRVYEAHRLCIPGQLSL